ncbi:MAG: helix-turn-helix transcriptional regulator [Polyangiales bacterium]
MQLRIERGALARSPRRESGPVILLPLESSVVELRTSEAHRLDRTSIALIPAGVRHRVSAVSSVAQLLTLCIEERDRRTVCREYRPHVTAERLERYLSEELCLSRTRWFDEIAHRYLFERESCEKPESQAARFLETELTKEIFFLVKERTEAQTRASVVQEGTDIVKRARALIEHSLFSPLKVDELARTCRTSESSLLRAFKREVGVAPATFVRDRRLDEALLMLESGRYTASEIATRVGYASLPAFSAAFSRRFGVAPSRVRVASPTLPPQGQTESRKSLTRSRK